MIESMEVLAERCVRTRGTASLREGKADMCKAIDDMRRESREEGAHGSLLENARSLIANTGWDAMEALRMLGVPEDDRPAIARELGAL